MNPHSPGKFAVMRIAETRIGMSTPVRLAEPIENPARASNVVLRVDQSARSGIDDGTRMTTLRPPVPC